MLHTADSRDTTSCLNITAMKQMYALGVERKGGDSARIKPRRINLREQACLLIPIIRKTDHFNK